MIRRAVQGSAGRWALGVIALLALGADWRSPPPGEGPESIPVRRIDDAGYVAVNDLARLLDATKFWRADVRKLALRSGSHTVVFTVDNPFVLVDDATVWLGAPVRSRGGEIHVPVALVDSLPRDSTWARLTYDARRQRVVVLPTSGGVGTPRIAVAGDVTRITFPADRAEEAVVVTRARAHLRLRFGGVFVGSLPDSLPVGSLLGGLQQIATAGGCAFDLRVDAGAEAFRLVTDAAARRVVLELVRERRPGFSPFAPESPPGERPLRVVVLDPGHGGADHGVTAGEAVEKDLTLALARRLGAELQRQGIRVVLTRDDDRRLLPQQRAELANRVGASLVIALHFDGYGDGRARGATAYCAPATFVDESEGEVGSRLTVLPWRDVATRHAVQSRALAEAVLAAIELRGLGPTRLREHLPWEFLGVNAPGILLECATLTATGDRDRVLQEIGLEQLAVTLAAGVAAYRRNE